VHFNTGIEDAFGENVLEGLHLVDNATGEKRDLKVNGLFYGIGHQPNSKLVAGQIELDEAGYVKVRQCRGVELLLTALYMNMTCIGVCNLKRLLQLRAAGTTTQVELLTLHLCCCAVSCAVVSAGQPWCCHQRGRRLLSG
jgi:alkyl hydroperoxide reductase subunit AhpF